jgi:hypothetical protein
MSCCPYCFTNNRLVASAPSGIHAGRLDCTECDRFVRWLSNYEIKDLLFDIRVVSDRGSIDLWDEFVKQLPPSARRLCRVAVRTGIVDNSLIIIFKSATTLLAAEGLQVSLEESWSKFINEDGIVKLSSISIFEEAARSTNEFYGGIFQEDRVPVDLIFACQYCHVLDYRDFGSQEWWERQIDEVLIEAEERGYKSKWVLESLNYRFNLPLSAYVYLGQSLDYHTDWAIINYQKSRERDLVASC